MIQKIYSIEAASYGSQFQVAWRTVAQFKNLKEK